MNYIRGIAIILFTLVLGCIGAAVTTGVCLALIYAVSVGLVRLTGSDDWLALNWIGVLLGPLLLAGGFVLGMFAGMYPFRSRFTDSPGKRGFPL
jgi:hypothetical protein